MDHQIEQEGQYLIVGAGLVMLFPIILNRLDQAVKYSLNLMLLLQVQPSQLFRQRCPSNGSIHRNVG